MSNGRHLSFEQFDSGGLFQPAPADQLPPRLQRVQINWDRAMAKRPQVLATVDEMPMYLLKPEVNRLLDLCSDPTDRLIIDLMWSTGARISEVLALNKERFIYDGYDFQILMSTLKQPGRPKHTALTRSPKRLIPIWDPVLRNRIEQYLMVHSFKKGERLFSMCRQTVDRHIKALVKRAGGSPIRISSHTFRHSFAVHLVLHGRPLKVISQLLGHRSVESTEIYTKVLTSDGSDFLEGVNFH